jgi:uncharacterized protein
MSEVSYEQGVFCWVDLSAHDMEAAKRWDGRLFGWEMTPSDDPNMPYSMAMQGGKMIAGIGQMPPDMQKQGVPPVWTSYAWVEDCAKIEAAAREAGATVLMPTMAVGDAGSMAILQDPGGAVMGLWQPGQHGGAQVVGEPNSMCWNELMTRDVEQAKRFYGAVLGWAFKTMPMGDFDYTVFELGEREVGGMMAMDGPMWEGVPAHWMAYFAVADVDATCKKAGELGGKICVPPTDIPVGRFAVLEDPQGGTFSVLTLSPPTA